MQQEYLIILDKELSRIRVPGSQFTVQGSRGKCRKQKTGDS